MVSNEVKSYFAADKHSYIQNLASSVTPKPLILCLALQWLLALTASAATATHDAEGRLVRVTYADGSTIDYPRDSNGNQLDRIVTRPVELTLTVDPPGSGTVTGAGRYSRKTQQSLAATAGSGFVFAAWKRADDTILSTSPNYTHTITEAETLTAHFVATGPAGSLDLQFNPNANNSVTSMAVQPDGKFIIGGTFTLIDGVMRNCISRFNADTTLDASFNPNVNSQVASIAVQTDGKIVIGGGFTSVGGVARSRIARLNADGSLDTNFNPNADNMVGAFVLQHNGMIVVCGQFTSLNGVTRNRVGRLHADGTLDTGFDPNGNDSVYCMAVQADNKIVIGGGFTTIAGVTRNHLARLNPDGSLDSTFNPNVSGDVFCAAIQSDGKILIGGYIRSVGGATRNNLARLNPDGSLDTTFTSNADDGVYALLVQADGKIVLCGWFRTLNAVVRNRIARLNANGSLDTTFNPDANNWVGSAMLQANGKIVIGGTFSAVGGVARNRIARLENEFASQSFAVSSLNRLQWLRGGGSPETQSVTFDVSSNGGSIWTNLGSGARIASGWEKTGLSLPASGLIRARARTSGGSYNGSSGLVEAVATYNLMGPDILVEQPVGTNIASGGTINFGNVDLGANSSLDFTIKNAGTADLTGLTITKDGTDAEVFAITASPIAPVSSPSGTTSFTVQFAPTSAGDKTAALHIASNDADENPFNIILSGRGNTASETWRKQYFNTTDNSDDAADEAMPMRDGISNLMKFATGMNPSETGIQPGRIQRSGASIVFTYNRRKAALSDGVQFVVEWSDTLAAGSWSTAEVSSIATDQGGTEKVDVTIPSGTSQGRFLRLRVSR